MNEPMVPRYEPNICDCSDGAHLDWCESPDGYVRNSDAALLESVVRAADNLRAEPAPPAPPPESDPVMDELDGAPLEPLTEQEAEHHRRTGNVA